MESGHILSLANIFDELDFLQIGLSEELATSLILQIAFLTQSLSTTLDISMATSDCKIRPESIQINDRGIVSLEMSSCIAKWQSKQSDQFDPQYELIQFSNDSNRWLRSNLKNLSIYSRRLHCSNCNILVSALENLTQLKYIDLSDIFANQDLFSLFSLLFSNLGIITGARQTPLMILIKFHPQRIKDQACLNVYQTQIGLQDSCGCTALMYAVHYEWRLCSILVQHEARIADKNGRTALMHAAIHGNRDALLILIPYEATCATPQGYTALMHAASNHRLQCVLDLIPYEAGMTSNSDDIRNGEGFTALMAAADAGATDIVSALLPYEAWLRQNPNEEFPLGKRAYDYAITRNRILCAQIIQKYDIESYA